MLGRGDIGKSSLELDNLCVECLNVTLAASLANAMQRQRLVQKDSAERYYLEAKYVY